MRVAVRTLDETLKDRVPGLAAEVAFFALLSLPPLLLIAAASISFLSDDLTTRFVDGLVTASREAFTPDTIDDVIAPTLELLVDEDRRIDVVSVGFLVTIFSTSRAVRVVLGAISLAYDLEDQRPTWRERLYAVGLTVVTLLLTPLLVPLLVAGPNLGDQLVLLPAVPDGLADYWVWAYWPLVIAVVVVLVATLYHMAAPWWTPWRRDLPGAVLTVSIWLAGSEGLRTYAERSIGRTVEDANLYGPLAGPLVLLVWLWLLGFALLLGAELNAELEREYPSPEKLRASATERLRDGLSRARARIAG